MTTKIPAELSSTPGIVDNSDATAITITSDEEVGIGTTTPNSYAFNDPAKLVVANTSGNSTISIASGTTSIGYLAFADGTSGTARYAGSVQYNHNASYMSFHTNDGTEGMRIDSAGHVTKALQPAVLVSKSGSQLDIAVGSGTTHTFDSEIFDVNGDFSSNTFTAPVTGKYLVTLQIRWQNIPTNMTYIQTWLATSNGTRYMGLFGSGTDLFNATVDYYRDGQSLIIDMDANDTFTVYSHQSGGTQQTDIGQESYLSVALLS